MKKIEKQVEEYLNYCEKVRGMSSATMVMKRNVLERFKQVLLTEGIVELEALTNKIFNKWVAEVVKRGVSPRSVNTYDAIVLAMVRYYREMGMEMPLQMALVGKMREGATRRKFYTDEEVETAISHADFETELMIRIMFETGMRIAELTRLKVSDFAGRRVQFLGKGKKPREAYVRKETLWMVQKFVQRKDEGFGFDCSSLGGSSNFNEDLRIGASDYLWATLNGEPPTVATIRKRLRRPFYEAGFTDFYPHALRHSFATRLQLRGASVEEIKEMIGHESVATTERYLHGFEGKLEELFNKYG